MAEVNFRKVDVDQYNPDRFLAQDLIPPQPPVSAAEMKQRQVEVKRALSSGDYENALVIALTNPPYGGDEETKNINLQTVLDVLTAIRSTNITSIVQNLSSDLRDILIKYIYKGMGSTVGQTHGNGGVLLAWFEKTVAITSEGAIVRYMSDRRTV